MSGPMRQLELPLHLTPQYSTEVSLSRDEDGSIVVGSTATIREWGRTSDAAEILGVSKETVRQMRLAGILPWRRPAKRWVQIDLIEARMLARSRG